MCIHKADRKAQGMAIIRIAIVVRSIVLNAKLVAMNANIHVVIVNANLNAKKTIKNVLNSIAQNAMYNPPIDYFLISHNYHNSKRARYWKPQDLEIHPNIG